MHKLRFHFPYSPVKILLGTLGALLLVYIGLIAVVMSYAAITVEFSQSVRNGEASIAVLEGEYLAGVARITSLDYVKAGYARPSVKVFVRADSVTALR
jgi:hypothetical protein